MVEQDHPGIAVVFPHLRHDLCEVETRHDVRDDEHVLSIDLGDRGLPFGCVGEGDDHIGVAVLHRLVRDEGMEERLNRWRGCRGVQ